MKCPICGGADLKHETRDVTYEYKGHQIVVRGITGDFCDECDEVIYNAEMSAKFSTAVAELHREVNSREVDPAFIATVRKRLNLDQRQAAEIFGGGANAFSRYETGRVAPPRPLVQLFRVLDKHPEMLDEIKYA